MLLFSHIGIDCNSKREFKNEGILFVERGNIIVLTNPFIQTFRRIKMRKKKL